MKKFTETQTGGWLQRLYPNWDIDFLFDNRIASGKWSDQDLAFGIMHDWLFGKDARYDDILRDIHAAKAAKVAQPTVKTNQQPTVREINAHLASCSSYCYIDLPGGGRIRISRARSRKGVVEGRVILGSPKAWEVIPADAVVELS